MHSDDSLFFLILFVFSICVIIKFGSIIIKRTRDSIERKIEISLKNESHSRDRVEYYKDKILGFSETIDNPRFSAIRSFRQPAMLIQQITEPIPKVKIETDSLKLLKATSNLDKEANNDEKLSISQRAVVLELIDALRSRAQLYEENRANGIEAYREKREHERVMVLAELEKKCARRRRLIDKIFGHNSYVIYKNPNPQKIDTSYLMLATQAKEDWLCKSNIWEYSGEGGSRYLIAKGITESQAVNNMHLMAVRCKKMGKVQRRDLKNSLDTA